jgi:hypothetical protein
MRERWRNPEYRAAQEARMKARFEDPVERAVLAMMAGLGGKISGERRRLPEMTRMQKLFYNKLRSKRVGWSRERALAAVMVVT